MKTFVILLSLAAFTAALAEAQEASKNGSRATRVHLRNGSFIDGELVRATPREWVLRLPDGEISVRRDQVRQVEALTLRSLEEAAPKLKAPSAAMVAQEAPRAAAGPKARSVEPAAGREMARIVDSLRKPRKIRKEAILEALQGAGKTGAAGLTEMFETLEPAVLQDAVAAVREFGDKNALAPARKLLESRKAEVRISALQLFESLGESRCLSDLRPLVEDPDPEVRSAAINSLVALDDIDSFNLLGQRLSDPDSSVRGAARNGLFAFSARHDRGEDVVRMLLEKIIWTRGEATAETLAAIGACGKKEAWEPVSRYLWDEDAGVRGQAAMALARLCVPESGEVLLNRMDVEREYWPRIQLAGAVQALKLKKAVEPLMGWMEDDDMNIKLAAIRALRQITGQSFGTNRDKWVAWWNRAKPRE